MSVKNISINGVTIKKDDIVKIKFRKLEDILQDNRSAVRMAQVVDHYDIQEHIKSFLVGGHFTVKEVMPKEEGGLHLMIDSFKSRRNINGKNIYDSDSATFLSEFEIEDHVVGYKWRINELLIESISVENDVAETYFSENHQLSLVLIDSVLYINGNPLTKTDSKILEMFEKVLAEAAINNALASEADCIEKEEG